MTVSEATAPLPAVSTYVEESRAKRSRRATFIKWLRHVHGWVGLWGAALGMLFGVTGFVLNHRVEPLRTFGVACAHVVAAAVGVGEERRAHVSGLVVSVMVSS